MTAPPYKLSKSVLLIANPLFVQKMIKTKIQTLISSMKTPHWALNLSLFLLGLMVSIPFLEPRHRWPIPSFYEDWNALMLGTLAVLTVFFAPLRRLSLPSIALLPILLCIAAFLQFLTGISSSGMDVLFYCGSLAWAAAMVYLGSTLSDHLGRERVVRGIALAILAGALLSALLAIMQRVDFRLPGDIAFPSVNGRILANVGQPNLLATYLWMGICALLYFRATLNLSLVYALAGLLIFGSAVGLTSSRIGLLHGLVLAVAAFWIASRQPGKKMSEIAFFLLGTTLFAYLSGEASRLLPWKYAALTPSAFERLRAGITSGDARLDIWRDAIHLILEHPWLGNGVGHFPWRMVEAAASAPEGAATFPGSEHSHNLFLQLGFDFGLIVTALVCLALLRWIFSLRHAPSGIAGYFALALLILLGVHSQLEYPLWYPAYLGLFALLFGVLDSSPRYIAIPRRTTLVVAFTGAVLALIPVRMDLVTLENVIYDPEHLKQSKTDSKERIKALENLSLNSSLAAHARIAFALMMLPEPDRAKAQSQICESAMRLWPDHVLILHCAILRQMSGRMEEGQALYDTLQKAFRRGEQQADIKTYLEMAKKRNPGVLDLGVSSKNKETN